MTDNSEDDTLLYERLALSRDEAGRQALAQQGHEIHRPEDLIKDPVVLEFTGLPESSHLQETDLEEALMNPPIGLLLCAEKNEAVVRYTLPEDNKQIFTARYQLYLPTEQELQGQIQTVHNNRRRQLARRCARYPAQALAKFPPQQRYALLVAYLDDLSQELTDQALDMFGKMMAELLRKGEHQQEQHFQTNARSVNGHLHLMADALDAFLTAHKQALDPYATVFAVADEKTLEATVQQSRAVSRPADLDFLDLIEGRYSHMRSALFALPDTLISRGAGTGRSDPGAGLCSGIGGAQQAG